MSWSPTTAIPPPFFKANRAYMGNYEGQRPLIDEVTLVPVKNAEALSKLEAGELNIINKISDNAVIAEGVELYGGAEAEDLQLPALGQGFIGFANEQGPTSSISVRKAIAYSWTRKPTPRPSQETTAKRSIATMAWASGWPPATSTKWAELMTTYPLALDAAKRS
jgi:hypothetical protein